MCRGPAWKREVVQDHKFDFIDVRDFTDNGFSMRMKYLWVYLIVLKDFLVYVSDIFTAVTMISTTSWVDNIIESCGGADCLPVPPIVSQWLFFGCIIFSFFLLAYESRKARRIIASRDISYAFTNVMANNYYSLRSYDHFCFFDHISNSTKKKDDLALFVFFTFKSWKRVMLADGPRQTINALVLTAIIRAKARKSPGAWYDIMRYFPDKQKLSVSALTVSMFFTVLVFAGSLLLLIAAACIYIPLLCYIQGNLKEYVCHKVDKRISVIIKRRNKERLARAAELAKKEAMGDYSHLKNKKGEMIAKPLPQPTLPNLSVDDDYDDDSIRRAAARTPAPAYGAPAMPPQDSYFYSSGQGLAPPPHQMAYHQQQGYGHYPNSSQGTVYDDNESTMHLTGAMVDQSNQPSPGLPLPNPHNQYHTSDASYAYSGFEELPPQQPQQPQRQQQQQQQQWYQGRVGYAQ